MQVIPEQQLKAMVRKTDSFGLNSVNKATSLKINVTSQFYMKNQNQEKSLKVLREKAREHESELKQRYKNTSIEQVNNFKSLINQPVNQKTLEIKLENKDEEFKPIKEENAYENCHIYENSSKSTSRAKSADVYLNVNNSKNASKHTDDSPATLSKKSSSKNNLITQTTNSNFENPKKQYPPMQEPNMTANRRNNRSMELLDYNGYVHQSVPFVFMPQFSATTRRHRRHHHRHLNDIDWSHDYDREREKEKERYYAEKYDTSKQTLRKSRPKIQPQTDVEEVIHHRQVTPRGVVDRVFHYRKARSHSTESKLNNEHKSLSRSNSPESRRQSPKIKSASTVTRQESSRQSKVLSNDSSAVVDTAVQTNTTESKSNNASNQTENSSYVAELKSQLDILKNEITRLQNAQTSLEQSLKQSTVLRPIIYSGSGFDQNDFGEFGLEQFMQGDFGIDNQNELFAQSFMFDPTKSLNEQLAQNAQNAFYVQDLNNQFASEKQVLTKQSQSQSNLAQKSVQNMSIQNNHQSKQTTTTNQNVQQNVQNVSNDPTRTSTSIAITSSSPNQVNEPTTTNASTNKTKNVSANQTAPMPMGSYNPVRNLLNPTAPKPVLLNKQQKPPATVSKPPVQPKLPPPVVPLSYDHLLNRQNNPYAPFGLTNPAQKPNEMFKPVSIHPVAANNPTHNDLPSPNAQLYQKLLKLVSNSVDLSDAEISGQMSTLLSNPNIKARLKQLHAQLLQDPEQYWPKLENILIADGHLNANSIKQIPNGLNSRSISNLKQSPVGIVQDLIDLRRFYSKESAQEANKTQPRIISRDMKK